jgi:hypothetical protein
MLGTEPGRVAPSTTPTESQAMPQIPHAGGVVRDTVLLALRAMAKHANDTACNVGISSDMEQTTLTELKLSNRYPSSRLMISMTDGPPESLAHTLKGVHISTESLERLNRTWA